MAAPLQGDRIAFADNHFEPALTRALGLAAESLGATLAATPQEATIIFTHPATAASQPSTSSPIPSAPYTWLAACAIAKTRVDPDTPLPPLHPKLLNAQQHDAPLRVWISLNIKRWPREGQPEDIRQSLADKLAAIGAVIVDKRGQADVLVVDRETNFFKKTIEGERQKHGRDWQRIEERDWIEDIIATAHDVQQPQSSGHVFITQESSASARADEARRQREDSFVEEIADPDWKRGPGRPTGIPRVDYTPHDDDFLLRYLAVFHPGGSWGSRKTYEIMCLRAATYPTAERHSAQSWHERFKKNSATFTRRVQRFIAQGIDEQLLTEMEQERAAKKEKRKSAAAAPQAGPSRARNDKAEGLKRKLVNLDDDELSVTVQRAPKAKVVGSTLGRNARTEAARRQAGEKEGAAAPFSLARTEPVQATAAPEVTTVPAAVIEAQAVVSTVTTVASTSAVGEPPAPAAVAEPAPQPVVEPEAHAPVAVEQPAPEEETPKDADAMQIDGEETQALLSGFKDRLRAIKAKSPVKPAAVEEPAPAAPMGTTTTITTPTPVSKRPRVSEPQDPAVAPVAPPLAQPISPSHPAPVTSPRPNPRRTVADEIAWSASCRKSVDRPTRALATVNATATLPPSRPHTPAAAPAAASTSTPAPAPEILSPAQRAERVAAGQQRVAQVKAEFQARIARFAAQYGVRPSKIFDVVNALPRRTGADATEFFWHDVEVGLEEWFRRKT